MTVENPAEYPDLFLGSDPSVFGSTERAVGRREVLASSGTRRIVAGRREHPEKSGWMIESLTWESVGGLTVMGIAVEHDGLGQMIRIIAVGQVTDSLARKADYILFVYRENRDNWFTGEVKSPYGWDIPFRQKFISDGSMKAGTSLPEQVDFTAVFDRFVRVTSELMAPDVGITQKTFKPESIINP